MISDHRRAGRTAWSRAVSSRLAAGLLAGTVLAGGLPSIVTADDLNPPGTDAFASPAPSTASPADGTTKPKNARKASERDKRVSLSFKAASWSKVLKCVARHSGLTLVMSHIPPGQFTRNDFNQYTVAEAIWILNHDLEHVGYRVIRQGDFLMVMDLDGLRSDYRPSVVRRSRDDDPDSATGVRPVSATELAPETPQEKATAAAVEAENEEISKRQVRIMYLSTPWSTVLPKFAEQAGLILVMKRCPVGVFHHSDWSKMAVPQAIEIMNKALDDTSFRLVRQDKFLVVLYTEDLRTEYERPIVGQRRIHVPQAEDTPMTPARTRSDVRQVSNEEVWNSRSGGNIPASLDPRRDADPEAGPILVNADANVPEAARPAATRRDVEPRRPLPADESSTLVQSTVFVPRHGRAAVVAQQLYRGLRQRAELITPGLQGLPSFRVLEVADQKKAKSSDKTCFTVGFDSSHNQLVIEARSRHLRGSPFVRTPGRRQRRGRAADRTGLRRCGHAGGCQEPGPGTRPPAGSARPGGDAGPSRFGGR